MSTWPGNQQTSVIGDKLGRKVPGPKADEATRDEARRPDEPDVNGSPRRSYLAHSLLQLVLLGLLPACPLACAAPPPPAAPVRMVYPEGTLHGFLVLTDTRGAVLAHGDSVQTVDGPTVNSKMTFRFSNGSYFEEKVSFTQEGVFRVRRYSLTARGPSFPKEWQISLDADTGQYRVETRSPGRGKPEKHEGKIELPADVYNGMVPTIAKNVVNQPLTRVHIVAFLPKPRVVAVELTPSNTGQVMLGDSPRQVLHFVVRPKLGNLESTFAKWMGKIPPDNHLWLVTDEVPAFVRADAVLVPDGPVWRIALAVPRFPEVSCPPR